MRLPQRCPEELDLSAPDYHRVLKLTRTLADLAGHTRYRGGAPGQGDPVPAEEGGISPGLVPSEAP
ncbi:MAG TPA: hypothetical protein VF909_11080 [Roseiflexaceae bacterium]